MTPDHSIKLAPDYAAALTFETYPAAPQIEGVWTQALRKNRSENGAFMEYLRLNDAGVQDLPGPLTPRQISVSWAAAGRINAFHIHVKAEQNEIWCVLSGQLVVCWWIAGRKRQPRREAQACPERRAADPRSHSQRRAHGYQAGEAGATLIYTMDAQFNLADPNEGRFAVELFWR